MKAMKMHYITSPRQIRQTLKEAKEGEANQGDHNHREMRRKVMKKLKM